MSWKRKITGKSATLLLSIREQQVSIYNRGSFRDFAARSQCATLRQLLQQLLPARPGFVARFLVGFRERRDWLARLSA